MPDPTISETLRSRQTLHFPHQTCKYVFFHANQAIYTRLLFQLRGIISHLIVQLKKNKKNFSFIVMAYLTLSLSLFTFFLISLTDVFFYLDIFHLLFTVALFLFLFLIIVTPFSQYYS